MSTSDSMASRIREALAAKEISLSELARDFGVSRVGLHNRIRDGKVDDEELLRIAARVGRPVWWLRYGVATPDSELQWMAGELRSLLQRVETKLSATDAKLSEGADTLDAITEDEMAAAEKQLPRQRGKATG